MTDSQSNRDISELERENELLKKENERLNRRLETLIKSQKKYYETHKDEVKARSKEYMKIVDPDKRKKWNRNYYLNRKKKLEEKFDSSE